MVNVMETRVLDLRVVWQFAVCLIAFGLLGPHTAQAATMGSFNSAPSSISLAPGQSGSYSGETTVQLSDSPVSGEVDVFFVIDSSESMSSFLGLTQFIIPVVANNLIGNNPAMDFHWGLADYRDFTDGEPYASQGLNMRQTLTHSVTDLQTALNSITATGGGDIPEQSFAALKNVAEGWLDDYDGRNDAQRLLVWAGDAPANEPGGLNPTLNDTLRALNTMGVQVFGLSNAAAGQGIDTDNQATDITDGTGGHLFTNINFGSSGQLTTNIEDALNMGINVTGSIAVTVEGDLGDWYLDVVDSPEIGPWQPDDSPIASMWDIVATAPGYADSRTVTLTLRADGAPLATYDLALNSAPIPTPSALLASVLLLGLIRLRRV